MRRKLAYSNPALTDTVRRFGMLPKGDWHVGKTGGKLFVGDTDWNSYAILGETVNEEEFHLAKTTSMLVQAQDKTTCRNVAIESKPAYDIFVSGGGASKLLHQGLGAVLAPSRRVVGGEDRESMHRPQGVQEADNVGRYVAHRHQGGEWLANRLHRRRGTDAVEQQYPGNGCFRTGRWGKHVQTGESFLQGFGLQGGTGLAAMLASRTVGGGDHGLRLLRRRHRPLLALSLGVAA